MAEVFGIVSGAAGIAALFTACIDCFDYVQAGRHLNRDYQTERLKLECARYRLARWGTATNVDADPAFKNVCKDQEQISLAGELLRQIIVLFRDTTGISDRYKDARFRPNTCGTSEAGATEVDADPGEVSSSMRKMSDKLKALTTKRSKGVGLGKRTTWAVYHSDELRRLSEDIVGLLDQLEAIIKAPDDQKLLVQSDVQELATEGDMGEEDVACLVRAAGAADKELVAAVQWNPILGHKYENIVIREQARVLNGDSVSSDWQGKTSLSLHHYSGVTVGGESRLLMGNKYGGKDFWDD